MNVNMIAWELKSLKRKYTIYLFLIHWGTPHSPRIPPPAITCHPSSCHHMPSLSLQAHAITPPAITCHHPSCHHDPSLLLPSHAIPPPVFISPHSSCQHWFSSLLWFGGRPFHEAAVRKCLRQRPERQRHHHHHHHQESQPHLGYENERWSRTLREMNVPTR